MIVLIWMETAVQTRVQGRGLYQRVDIFQLTKSILSIGCILMCNFNRISVIFQLPALDVHPIQVSSVVRQTIHCLYLKDKQKTTLMYSRRGCSSSISYLVSAEDDCILICSSPSLSFA